MLAKLLVCRMISSEKSPTFPDHALEHRMRVIGLAGWSGAGKTTLLVKLIPELKSRGLSVSTLKHAHHAFDIDRPGKDSFEHREAGATEVLIASGRRWALMHELVGEDEPRLSDLLRHLSPVDVAVVEGFKSEGHPKIEVYRVANRKPLLFSSMPNVKAIASDGPVPGSPVPVIALDDTKMMADAVLAHAEPVTTVISALEALPAPKRIRSSRAVAAPDQ
jgi:molybdopterin-guanine dinucleotide biosynthesis adapter protein